MALYNETYKIWYDDWYRDQFVLNKKISEGETSDSKSIVWISKPYDPNDLRHNAPVPTKKVFHRSRPTLEKSYHATEYLINPWTRRPSMPYCPSSQATRSEEWSILKCMLPSRGIPVPSRPPNWGTDAAVPPKMVYKKSNYFPMYSSPMTRFAEEMRSTNRLFQLY